MELRRVVLPEPEGPQMAKSLPGLAEPLMFLSRGRWLPWLSFKVQERRDHWSVTPYWPGLDEEEEEEVSVASCRLLFSFLLRLSAP